MGMMTAGNGMKIDLLWTNPSPNGNFVKQSISVDASGYDAVMVIMTPTQSRTMGSSVSIISVVPNEETYPGCFSPDGVWIRYMTIKSGSIYFSNAVLAGSNGATTNETHAIPAKIYGIKF